MADDKEIVIKISAANLTDAEFQKARAGIAGIATEASGAKGGVHDLGGAFDDLKTVAGQLGIALGAMELVNFGKEIVSLGADIKNGAEILNVSAETYQRWKYAVEQSNGSMDGLSRSVVFLNKTIGAGGDSTKTLLRDLGLNFEALKLEDEKTRFEEVTKAIADQRDPILQDEAAVKLLGRSAAENLAAYKAGLKDVGDQAPVMSNSTVGALDLIDKAVNREITTSKSWAATILLNLLPALGGVAKAVADEKQKVDESNAVLNAGLSIHAAHIQSNKDIAASLAIRGVSLDVLEELQAKADKETEASIRLDQDRQDATARLTAALVPLSQRERDRIQIALDWYSVGGHLVVNESDLVKAYGFTEAAIKTVTDTAKQRSDTEQSLEKLAAETHKVAMARFDELIASATKEAQHRAQTLADTVVADADATRRLEEDAMSLSELRLAKIDDDERAEIAGAAKKYDTNSQYYADLIEKINGHYQHERDLATGTADTIEQRMAEQGVFTKGVLDDIAERAHQDFLQMLADGNYTSDQLVDAWTRYHQKAAESGSGFTKAYHEMMAGLTDDIYKLIDGARGGWDSFKSAAISVFDDIARYFEKEVAEKIAAYLISITTGGANAQASGAAVSGAFSGASEAAASAAATSAEAGTSGTAAATGTSAAWISAGASVAAFAAVAWGVWKIWDAWAHADTPHGDPKDPVILQPGDPTYDAWLTAHQKQYDADIANGIDPSTDPLLGGWKPGDPVSGPMPGGFAEGGIALGPTLGVFGEAGPEALVPLDRYDQLLQGASRGSARMEALLEQLLDRIDQLSNELPFTIGREFKAAVLLTV